MIYKNILITGGAGFVGSNFSIAFKKKYPNSNVIALDNLKRRGSELNIPRLKEAGVSFVHGDVRNKEDLEFDEKIDVIIECSAEPSVLAGVESSLDYLINSNLIGAVNCLNLARKQDSVFMFLSTSRVYPVQEQNQLKLKEKETRFELLSKQPFLGISEKGISENFPLGTVRTFYGATKLCAEYLIQEYASQFGIKAVINRCGVITGPWQMGKVDQGVIVLWMARHYFKKELSYIGYDGKGKQVRDFLNVHDLFLLLDLQLKNITKVNGEIFNVGGGREISVSLLELTDYCQRITGNKIPIKKIKEGRTNDVPLYITDNSKIQKALDWKPNIGVEETLKEIFEWVKGNESFLKSILS